MNEENGKLKRKIGTLQVRMGASESEEDEVAEKAKVDKFPNMPMSEHMKETVVNAKGGHEIEDIKELKNPLIQNKGSCVVCGYRATKFCIQCTFIHNLPRGIVACCEGCFASHTGEPTKKREKKVKKGGNGSDA